MKWNDRAIALVDRQGWLDRTAEWLQPGVNGVFQAAGAVGQKAKDLLNGVWLGHPVHPALTDVPIGAWTAAVLLDASEASGADRGVGRAADAAVALGLAGAIGAAVTGLTDWGDTYGRARRLGLAHGLANVAATSLFAASLASRASGRRAAGRRFGLAGYLIAVGAAWIGGHLVFGERLGVNHAAGDDLPSDFVPVAKEGEVPENRLVRVKAGETKILLRRRGGRIDALLETCAHQGGPLAEGKLEGDTVVCPWHASRFDLATGEVVHGPSVFPQPCFEARVVNGTVEVRAR